MKYKALALGSLAVITLLCVALFIPMMNVTGDGTVEEETEEFWWTFNFHAERKLETVNGDFIQAKTLLGDIWSGEQKLANYWLEFTITAEFENILDFEIDFHVFLYEQEYLIQSFKMADFTEEDDVLTFSGSVAIPFSDIEAHLLAVEEEIIDGGQYWIVVGFIFDAYIDLEAYEGYDSGVMFVDKMKMRYRELDPEVPQEEQTGSTVNVNSGSLAVEIAADPLYTADQNGNGVPDNYELYIPEGGYIIV